MLLRPRGTAGSSGPEAVELAAASGLTLDPWQQTVLDVGMSEQADGSWAASECGLIASRQNGKNGAIEAREVFGLAILNEWIIHTSHLFTTTRESYDRLMALIAALYAAIPLYQTFPFTSLLPAGNVYVQIGLYLGFVLIGTVAFSGLSAFLARSTSSFLGTAVLSITTAGLVLAVAIHILPVQQIYTFSAPTLALFASAQMFFWWLLAPLAGLFFFGK